MKLYTILLAAIILILSSCRHRDIDYEITGVSHLDVVFDWGKEPDASPGSMSLYLFPANGGEPLRFEFAGREGGTIRVFPGVYDAICINSDVIDMIYKGTETHSSFEIITNPLSTMVVDPSNSVRSLDLPRAKGAEKETLTRQPAVLWSHSTLSFEVKKYNARKRSSAQELRMYPGRIVDTYVLSVKKIKNIESLKSMTATISGMSDGYLPGVGYPNNSSATLPIDLSVDFGNNRAQGTFITFGHCPDTRKNHKLMIYAILTNGARYYYEFDVSDLAHYPPDANNVHHIDVEMLELPQESGGNQGWGPSLDNWQSVFIDLSM